MTDLVTMMREYALDWYWRDSWDIVVDCWSDEDIARAIVGAKTRRGAIAKTWGLIQVLDRKRRSRDTETLVRYGRKPVKPVSLFEFLAASGGLKPVGDLIYILDGNPMIAGRGPLLRSSGMTLDHAREACAEAHYLADPAWSWEDGPSTSTIQDLLNLISDEARGLKCYPIDADCRFHADNRFHREEEDYAIPF